MLHVLSIRLRTLSFPPSFEELTPFATTAEGSSEHCFGHTQPLLRATISKQPLSNSHRITFLRRPSRANPFLCYPSTFHPGGGPSITASPTPLASLTRFQPQFPPKPLPYVQSLPPLRTPLPLSPLATTLTESREGMGEATLSSTPISRAHFSSPLQELTTSTFSLRSCASH